MRKFSRIALVLSLFQTNLFAKEDAEVKDFALSMSLSDSVFSEWVNVNPGPAVQGALGRVVEQLVLPIEKDDPLSGLRIIAEGVEEQGTLAYELFSKASHKSERLIPLMTLAQLPEYVEKVEKNLYTPEKRLLKALKEELDEIGECQLRQGEWSEASLSTVFEEKFRQLLMSLIVLKSQGVWELDLNTSTEQLPIFKGLRDIIKKEIRHLDPLNWEEKINYFKEVLAKYPKFYQDHKDNKVSVEAYNRWIDELRVGLKSLISLFDYKLSSTYQWVKEIQKKLDNSRLSRGLELNVVGTTTTNNNQVRSVIAQTENYSKIYVISAGITQPGTGMYKGVDIQQGLLGGAYSDPQLNEMVKAILVKNPNASFYCLGHGAGGGVATLAGLTIQKLIDTTKTNPESPSKNRVKIFGVAAALSPQSTIEVEELINEIRLPNIIYVDGCNDPFSVASLAAGYNHLGVHFLMPTDFRTSLEYGEFPGGVNHDFNRYLHHTYELRRMIFEYLEVYKTFHHLNKIYPQHLTDRMDEVSIKNVKELTEKIEEKIKTMKGYNPPSIEEQNPLMQVLGLAVKTGYDVLGAATLTAGLVCNAAVSLPFMMLGSYN